MSSSGASPQNGDKKRNLPSWMSSRQNANKRDGKKHEDVDTGEAPEQAQGRKTHPKENESSGKSSESNLGDTNSSKLLEGVVFVLSGFVNPERGQLRSQALEMGAEYQADWNSDCTLLVCAFPNTPKFRQVEADCGTIISKEWVSECYNKKKLVDIESYLMHAGKPWRRQSISHEARKDQEPSMPRKSQKKVESGSYSKPTTAASPKRVASNSAKDCFPPSEVKKWAIDDLEKTISWLESQEEKPEPSEIKRIAAEGILTCLQDTIDALNEGENINQVTDQWNFIPRVVVELIKLEGRGDTSGPSPKKDLRKQAMACQEIYEVELGNLDDDSSVKNKKQKTITSVRRQNERRELDYDSDQTIEMTEEEIDQAFNNVASKLNA
ncbi:hypothetical protein LguiB_023195 [Lonicera macranthoides]